MNNLNGMLDTIIATGESGNAEAILGLMLAFLGFFTILALVYYVLQVVAYWKIFTKAGEKGWKSIIPFYNEYIQFKLTWNTLYFWLNLVLIIVMSIVSNLEGTIFSIISSILGLVTFILYGVMANYHLARAFGHGIGFTIGLIFLNPIFKLILGFSRDTYVGNMSIKD